MNKAIKSLKLILVLIASVAITSCVQDDDYTIPNSLGDEENKSLTSLLETGNELTFAEVKALYQGGEFIEAVDTNDYVKGYVSSSDQTGNFFKEFFIQDSPTNPTSGLKVILNQVDTYNQFNLGREVYISLQGLFIGEERVGNGVTTIGGGTETDQFGTTVSSLNEIQIRQKVLRSTVTEELTPLNLGLTAINGSHVGVLVKVENVEFADDEIGLNYFDPIEVFDTQRILQDCRGFTYPQFILETSSFSSFKNEPLPIGNGSVTAVVSKTFDGASLILALNSTDDVNMDSARCSLLDPADFSNLFSEDFEGMSTGATVSGNGWTAYAEEGTYNWRALTTTDSGNPGPGNKIASMGAYNSGVPVNIAWLISPSIDLDSQELTFINFQSSNNFDDDSELELLISTDWDGNLSTITNSTWTSLPGNIVSDDTFYQDWVDSGLINLSNYSGTAYVAFKYVGGDNSGNESPNTGTIDGTFEIDNYRVLGPN
ncbi:DUF5689 domain-containing protein [Winogradskyella pacifica]|uniref:DUF5689 domain-containing protein n=1 Tax=Winogradskyella pacifica TaxID=664642 RepID=UPI0015CE58FF|nr:DUF5689 domain-containing protein [Winogradskyella pacifica]